jgi:hypothetical protein
MRKHYRKGKHVHHKMGRGRKPLPRKLLGPDLQAALVAVSKPLNYFEIRDRLTTGLKSLYAPHFKPEEAEQLTNLIDPSLSNELVLMRVLIYSLVEAGAGCTDIDTIKSMLHAVNSANNTINRFMVTRTKYGWDPTSVPVLTDPTSPAARDYLQMLIGLRASLSGPQ